MKRTAIYLRVSTVGQAQEGDSLAAQREALISYINAHNDLVLAGEYMDDGISGQKYEQRDELQRMLTDVKAGKIDLIICTKMDRLHRSLKHFLDMQEILDQHNVSWLAIWEPMYDTTTPAGQLIIHQMMSIAQFEAQNTGSRIRQVIDYKISQGQVVSGAVPCGYSIVDKKLVPNEIAPVVREVFEFYARTGKLHDTVMYCASVPGLPNFIAPVKNMLRNRKYIGEHRGNLSYCPPIVSKDVFDDVQRKLSMNVRKSQVYCNIFAGLCKCAECGNRLGVTRNKHRKKVHAYYRCQKHYCPPKTCGNKMTINELRIEEYLLANIKSELQAYVFECQQQEAPHRDRAKKIGELERKIDRLKDLYVNELITLEEYKADKERYLSEIASLSSVPSPEPVDTSALEDLLSQDISQYYSTLGPEDKRFFWRSIIKEIRIDVNKHIEVIFL